METDTRQLAAAKSGGADPNQPEGKGEKHDRLVSLDMVKTGLLPKFLGLVLLGTFFISIFALLHLDWRQSVVGNGEIIVFSPMQRPQTIEAQIPGRISNWYVRDGQTVKAGQLIADLAEMDPRFLDHNQLNRLVNQKEQLAAKRDSAKSKLASLSSQLKDLGNSREAAIPAARERIGQAKDRLFASQQSVEVAEQNVKTTQWQLDRINSLFEKGLRSQRDQQVALLDNTRAKTELQRAKSAYDVVNKDADIADLDFKKVSADTQATINSIKAASAEADQVIAATSADIERLEIDIQNMAERVQQRAVRSPCAGRVVRLNRVGAGETVAAGAVLATIVPGTEDRAAAIMLRDFDVPLVAVGDPVRLSITGWPSIQFVGWPSVAVGTFAGRVAVIDAVDDGKHQYRIIVVPDTEAISKKLEEPWPSASRLRPGAQATGWVLLKNVPLWWELWRQFNGFQATVNNPENESENKAGKSGTP